MNVRSISLCVCAFLSGGILRAESISVNDSSLIGWATGYENLVRGPNDISRPENGLASFGDPQDMLGKPGADGDSQPVVSLGDGGSVTLLFDNPITNGSGDDFAVFENAYPVTGGLAYLELAFVEVSSDGLTFTRFASESASQIDTQVSTFGTLDPNDITNLAGKDFYGVGTGFDLEELAGTPGLNTDAITHVRIIDVVGSIGPDDARTDSNGRIINDPWPTDFSNGEPGFVGTGGFDLDGVGVIHSIPEPSLLLLSLLGISLLIRHVSHRKA